MRLLQRHSAGMRYDVIVIGGGHAGCEAAAAAARMGASVALVTMRPDRIGAMSCNPAIGGVGKGHLVREVDVFDGIIARAADAAAVHYRLLNRSKGAAVHGPRVQADRRLYATAVQHLLAEAGTIDIVAGEAVDLAMRDEAATGVVLGDGRVLAAPAVVAATGTFLGATLHLGLEQREGGRIDEAGAGALARRLTERGVALARLKTGTPPRIDGRTIDWSRLEWQPSDQDAWSFSLFSEGRSQPQLACAITRTNPPCHALIAAHLDQSPLRSGAITGRGPRYCPSIEDKIRRFGDRDGHQIFLEPEGLDDALVYPNGISTSLPAEVQQAFVNAIPGLERARIAVPGYAVEYAHVDPRALTSALEMRALPGLFCAGQINGTTGYEEAAAQGLVAGLNAAAHAAGRPAILFDRAQSYIGVMVDDLTLQGVSEPYRMLTARAEYRLHLRADNAATRLGAMAVASGAVGPAAAARLADRARQLAAARAAVSPAVIAGVGRGDSADDLLAHHPDLSRHADVLNEVIDDLRYAPYLRRQAAEVARRDIEGAVRLDHIDDFALVGGLSTEMIERLATSRPATLEQAGRVPGVTPAALSALLVAAKR